MSATPSHYPQPGFCGEWPRPKRLCHMVGLAVKNPTFNHKILCSEKLGFFPSEMCEINE